MKVSASIISGLRGKPRRRRLASDVEREARMLQGASHLVEVNSLAKARPQSHGKTGVHPPFPAGEHGIEIVRLQLLPARCESAAPAGLWRLSGVIINERPTRRVRSDGVIKADFKLAVGGLVRALDSLGGCDPARGRRSDRAGANSCGVRRRQSRRTIPLERKE